MSNSDFTSFAKNSRFKRELYLILIRIKSPFEEPYNLPQRELETAFNFILQGLISYGGWWCMVGGWFALSGVGGKGSMNVFATTVAHKTFRAISKEVVCQFLQYLASCADKIQSNKDTPGHILIFNSPFSFPRLYQRVISCFLIFYLHREKNYHLKRKQIKMKLVAVTIIWNFQW